MDLKIKHRCKIKNGGWVEWIPLKGAFKNGPPFLFYNNNVSRERKRMAFFWKPQTPRSCRQKELECVNGKVMKTLTSISPLNSLPSSRHHYAIFIAYVKIR